MSSALVMWGKSILRRWWITLQCEAWNWRRRGADNEFGPTEAPEFLRIPRYGFHEVAAGFFRVGFDLSYQAFAYIPVRLIGRAASLAACC